MEANPLSLILDTDSYKLSHWKQYPPKTSAMYSYLESRGGEYDKTLFFGLQYYLKKYLSKPVTLEQVNEAMQFAKLHGVPFNTEGWLNIVNKYGGYLPVTIQAVPEGYLIPKKNILMSVESNDPQSFWVVSWLETLLVRLWYPITVATESYRIKEIILKYLQETSEDPNGEIPFKLHDFGSRGVSSQESAMIGGASHLVNFMGSDTIAGVWMANKYYNETMAGFSIPATEHSTMTMWGKENEVEAYRNMIKQYGDSPIFACVSDSYDIYNAADKLWGEKLKKEVEEMNAMLVVRPDSGDPVEVPIDLVKILDAKFGSTVNSKGFKVLNNVRVIQGDGIDRIDVSKILESAKLNGFSASNFAFGMGGGLLQKLNRDTHEFGFKNSWAMVDGKEVDVYKQPVTSSLKISKKGKLDLVKIAESRKGTIGIRTVRQGSKPNNSLLRTVYQNGKVLKEIDFTEVRENTKVNFQQNNSWKDKLI